MTPNEPQSEPFEGPRRTSREVRREQRTVRRQKRRDLVKDLLRVFVIALVFVLAGLLFNSDFFKQNFTSVESLREALHPDDSFIHQLRSYVVFIVVGSILMSIGLPRAVISVAAGGIYGAALGTAVSLLTQLLGATETYFLGRSFLKSTVKRRFGRRMVRLQERFRENGFRYTLTLRLFPISNPVFTSLLCGVCRVRFKDYMLANLIGFIPLTVIFAVFGSGAIKGKSTQIIVGIVLFIIVMLGQWVLSRMLKGREEPADETP